MSRRGEVDVSVGDSRGDADQVSDLPIFHNSLDWNDLFAKYPVPDVFERTVYKWSPERIRKMQSERFLELVAIGWANPFYSRRWSDAGIGPGDIRSLDDIVHLPIFTSEDIKNDQLENPPFGLIHSGAMALRGKVPLKVHTSGGTTGKPRPTLYGPLEWELNGLTFARGTYIQGGRPGDIHQIPSTNSLANFAGASTRAATTTSASFRLPPAVASSPRRVVSSRSPSTGAPISGPAFRNT
jgi:phenylacetate-CoA ligase